MLPVILVDVVSFKLVSVHHYIKIEHDKVFINFNNFFIKLELEIEKDDICQNVYLIYSPITQICAGGRELNRDTCQV